MGGVFLTGTSLHAGLISAIKAKITGQSHEASPQQQPLPQEKKSLFSKVGGFVAKEVKGAENKVKNAAVNFYHSSLEGEIGKDVKNMIQGSKDAMASASQGNFKGFVKNSGKVFLNAADAALMGEGRNATGIVKNYGKSAQELLKGNWKQAALYGEQGAIDSLKFAAGPLAPIIGPQSAQELNQLGKTVGRSAYATMKDVGQMAKHIGQGQFTIHDDFQKIVNSGNQFQKDATNLVVSSVTNVNGLRKLGNAGIGYINNATQDLGQGAVDVTGAATNLAHGRFKQAAKDTLSAAGNVMEGGGRLLGTGVAAAQMVSGAIPVVGQAASAVLAVGGAGLGVMGNIKEISHAAAESGKNFYQAGKIIAQGGSTKDALKMAGVGALEGVAAGTLGVTSALSGGPLKFVGGIGGKLVGQGISKATGKLTSSMSQKLAQKGVAGAAKALSGVGVASNKVVQGGSQWVGSVTGGWGPRVANSRYSKYVGNIGKEENTQPMPQGMVPQQRMMMAQEMMPAAPMAMAPVLASMPSYNPSQQEQQWMQPVMMQPEAPKKGFLGRLKSKIKNKIQEGAEKKGLMGSLNRGLVKLDNSLNTMESKVQNKIMNFENNLVNHIANEAQGTGIRGAFNRGLMKAGASLQNFENNMVNHIANEAQGTGIRGAFNRGLMKMGSALPHPVPMMPVPAAPSVSYYGQYGSQPYGAYNAPGVYQQGQGGSYGYGGYQAPMPQQGYYNQDMNAQVVGGNDGSSQAYYNPYLYQQGYGQQ